MRKLMLTILALVMTFAVYGGGQKAAGSGQVRVADIVAEYNEWNHLYYDQMKKMADEWGWHTEVFDSAQDVNNQINMVNSAVAQGFDFIVIQPVDNAALGPSLEKAVDAGVTVISHYDYDPNSTTGRKIYQVLFGQKEAGVLQAEEYVKLAGTSGNVALIGGLTGADNARRRMEGYHEVLDKYPGIKIAAEIFCDWDRQKAMAAAEDIITANPNLNAFLVQDDGMSWGVYSAIEAAGKLGQIKISSQGFYESSIPAIKEDKFLYTISYPAAFFARDAMNLCKDLKAGIARERLMYLGMELVTKANVDTAPF